MVKLRVEWHHKCPECGTEVVADFFDTAEKVCVCLWCGFFDQSACDAHKSFFASYVMQAEDELGCWANSGTAIKH